MLKFEILGKHFNWVCFILFFCVEEEMNISQILYWHIYARELIVVFKFNVYLYFCLKDPETIRAEEGIELHNQEATGEAMPEQSLIVC